MFPRDQHAQIFLDLSQYLRAIVSQRLVRGRNNKRVAAVEVMLNTPHIQDLIKKGDVIGVKEAMLSSNERGIQNYDSALLHLYKEGRIDIEEALEQRRLPHQPRGAHQLRLTVATARELRAGRGPSLARRNLVARSRTGPCARAAPATTSRAHEPLRDPERANFRSSERAKGSRRRSARAWPDQALKTVAASNTGPSTQTRFIAGPSGVWTRTVQPAQPPTPQAMFLLERHLASHAVAARERGDGDEHAVRAAAEDLGFSAFVRAERPSQASASSVT